MDLNPSGLSPVDLKVLVRPDPVEEKTKGGILLPDSALDKDKYATTRGTIIARGPNAFKDWGDGNAPVDGARVVFAQYAGLRVKGDDATDYLVMNDADVISEVAR